MRKISQNPLRHANTFLLPYLLLPRAASALFGFGAGSGKPDTAAARIRAMEKIRAKSAADEFIPPAVGVGRENADRYAQARAVGKLMCQGSGDPSVQVEIQWYMVNDDFCDCADGADEPGTSACGNGVFECANRGHLPLRLPSSRVEDGFCDCCDGSDEPDGLCELSCGEASEAWVELLADKMVKAEQGLERRKEYVQQAEQAAHTRKGSLEEASRAVEAARSEVAAAKEELKGIEQDEKEQRERKLAEWEDAVRAKLEGHYIRDSRERITALAVAVASADDAMGTLHKVTEQVLDGMKVDDVLNELSNGGKDKGKSKDKGGSKRRGKPILVVEDTDFDDPHPDGEPDLENDENDLADELENRDFDIDDYDTMQPYDDHYGGYGYGGDFMDDDFFVEDDAEMIEIEKRIQEKIHEDSHVARGEDGAVAVPELNPEEGVVVDTVSEPQQDSEDSEEETEEDDEEIVADERDTGFFKAPKQFERFKYETTEGVEARKRVKQLGDDLRVRDKKLKTLEEEASTDYGEDGALWPLKDKCVTHKTGNYEYSVCLFKDAHQNEKKSKTSIGKWTRIERSDIVPSSTGEHVLNGDVLVFERGQKCWNGPSRSLRVSLACGSEDVLSTVAEPETCTYTAVLETPAACSPGLREALLAEAGGGVLTETGGVDVQEQRTRGLGHGGDEDVFEGDL